MIQEWAEKPPDLEDCGRKVLWYMQINEVLCHALCVFCGREFWYLSPMSEGSRGVYQSLRGTLREYEAVACTGLERWSLPIAKCHGMTLSWRKSRNGRSYIAECPLLGEIVVCEEPPGHVTNERPRSSGSSHRFNRESEAYEWSAEGVKACVRKYKRFLVREMRARGLLIGKGSGDSAVAKAVAKARTIAGLLEKLANFMEENEPYAENTVLVLREAAETLRSTVMDDHQIDEAS